MAATTSDQPAPPKSAVQRVRLDRRTFLAGVTGVAGAAALAACATPTTSPGVPGGQSSPPDGELEPTKAWRISDKRRAPDTLISGYSGNASIVAGEPVPLFVSTIAKEWTAKVYRLGDYLGLGGALVASAGPFTGTRQPGPRTDGTTRMVDAPWSKSAELDSTGWPPGMYWIHITANGASAYVPLTVRSTDVAGKVIVVNSTTTLAAYNLWGGRSLYGNAAKAFDARSYAVSLDRPIDADRVGFLMRFEVTLARAAEAAGVPVAWMTNIDIAQHPELVQGAAGLVSPGHDEYWALPYRAAMQNLRDAGGNLAFTGANAGYWRVRIGDTANGPGRRVICYKSAALDPVRGQPDTTVRWRDAPDPKPENTLIGQLYDAFPVDGAMKVVDPSFFLFDGTGVREGDTFPRLIGDEIDRYYPINGTPHPIQLPAISPVTCRGKQTWSTMSYYSDESGAGVFATGTMHWNWGLPREVSNSLINDDRTKAFVKHVTHNLFNAMSAGPMGAAHPARDDANDANLPATNTSGAA